MEQDLEKELSNLFFSYSIKEKERIQKDNIHFAHYTSADAAIKIIRNKEVWMRNALCMNDFSEVRYGLQCLHEPYEKLLKPFLETIFPKITQEFTDIFDGWKPHFLYQTYLSCVSEHHEKENYTGRLSMWRTFSKTTGVAIVLNRSPFFSESNALNVYTSPVAYFRDSDFSEELDKMIKKMKSIEGSLREAGEVRVTNYLFWALKFAVLSTKHPGFDEEKEWRLIFSPSEGYSHLSSSIEVIDDIPQRVYKIPLKDFSHMGLHGTTIPELIDKIIIGPTQYPWPIHDAFTEVLREEGVVNPEKKVVVSDIPIRHLS